MGVLCLVAALVVRVYTALFHAAGPDWDATTGLDAARVLGGLGALLVTVLGLALRYRKKAPWRAVLSAALEQPGWWGTWYPRAFRRPGDVWHRLPKRIRRFHVAVGLTAIVFLFVSMPLPVLNVTAEGYKARTGRASPLGAQVLERTSAHPTVYTAIIFLPFAALTAIMAEYLLYRRRLVRTLGPSLPDPGLAEKALVTPSWNRSFWEKPPFDTLLLPESRAPSREAAMVQPPSQSAPGSPEAATMTRSAERLEHQPAKPFEGS